MRDTDIEYSDTDGIDTGNSDATPPELTVEDIPALPIVQDLDTKIRQLQHQRDSLPLKDDLKAATAKQVAHQRLIRHTKEQHLEVLTRQRRHENKAASLASNADAKHDLLYSGRMRSARDIAALQSEIETLHSRRSTLEDQAIEALIEVDELADRTKTLEAEGVALDEQVTVLEAELAATLQDIEKQLVDLAEAREQAAKSVDHDALEKYERLRPSFGHFTVVSFDYDKGCDCPNRMPRAEIVRIRNCDTGSISDCTECGRMVLR